MNRTFLLLVTLLFSVVPSSLFSQVKIGATGGVHSAGFSGSGFDYVPDTARPVFSRAIRGRIGVFYDIRINKFFSIRPELAYNQKGGEQKLDTSYYEATTFPGWNDDMQTHTVYRLNYLELPVLGRFAAHLFSYGGEGKKKKVSFEVLGGGYLSYLFGNSAEATVKQTRTSSNDPGINFVKTTQTKGSLPNELLNRWDYGVIGGIGFKTELSKVVEFYAEARYNKSLTNINNGHWDRRVGNPETKKMDITKPTISNAPLTTFSIGFIFNVGKEGLHFTPAE